MPAQADSSQLATEAFRIVEACSQERRVVRIYAATAIYYHCPAFRGLFERLGRIPGDIDLAAYSRDASKIAEIMSGLGYEEDLTVTAFGSGRQVFNRKVDGLHCDVFVGKLEMSHVLNFDRRLELDYPTAPLADLLLSKMQILKLNEKDAIDATVLLREHEVGKGDREVIDAKYVSDLCSRDWGLWRTVTGNLQKVSAMIPDFGPLTQQDASDVIRKARALQEAVEATPKSLAWKLRARVGDSRPWYNEVEDLYR